MAPRRRSFGNMPSWFDCIRAQVDTDGSAIHSERCGEYDRTGANREQGTRVGPGDLEAHVHLAELRTSHSEGEPLLRSARRPGPRRARVAPAGGLTHLSESNTVLRGGHRPKTAKARTELRQCVDSRVERSG
jgi:hypothetical protein